MARCSRCRASLVLSIDVLLSERLPPFLSLLLLRIVFHPLCMLDRPHACHTPVASPVAVTLQVAHVAVEWAAGVAATHQRLHGSTHALECPDGCPRVLQYVEADLTAGRVHVGVGDGSGEVDGGRRVRVGGRYDECECEAVVGVGCGGWCEDGGGPLRKVGGCDGLQLDGVEAAVGPAVLVVAGLQQLAVLLQQTTAMRQGQTRETSGRRRHKR